MTKSLLLTALAALFFCACHANPDSTKAEVKVDTVKPAPYADLVLNAFAQTPGTGDGNAAAIALSKAAIATFGLNNVFESTVDGDKIHVKLKTGTKVELTKKELQQATDSARFLTRFTGATSDGQGQKDSIAAYAQLCFAVMAKMVQKYGDNHYVYGVDSSGFVDSCHYTIYKDAIHDLNWGAYLPTFYFLLGLNDYVSPKATWAFTKKMESGIAWSAKHAMFVSYGKCDHYGVRKPLSKFTFFTTGRMAITKEKQTDHKRREDFKLCKQMWVFEGL